jgi:hypothetical protein
MSFFTKTSQLIFPMMHFDLLRLNCNVLTVTIFSIKSDHHTTEPQQTTLAVWSEVSFEHMVKKVKSDFKPLCIIFLWLNRQMPNFNQTHFVFYKASPFSMRWRTHFLFPVMGCQPNNTISKLPSLSLFSPLSLPW